MNGWYDGFGLYHGPNDPRFVVPKRIPMMGWTINVSHPSAPIIILAFGMTLGAALLAKLLS